MSNGFVNKVLDIFGMGDEDSEREIDGEAENRDEDEEIEVIQNSKKNRVLSIHSNQNAKIVIIEPAAYDEITNLCDCLKNRKIVIANLKNLDQKLAQRFVDFASGAAYALDGDVQQVSCGILLLTPSNVDVTSDLKEELSSKGIFNWTAK
ncbi:MAG: cell division protein SepF [Clostridiales bacterium]|nr:cell division protein SepF [Clostridiales bacterium]HBM79823.1 cell division protein SepF [Clostridiaceae bacterium]